MFPRESFVTSCAIKSELVYTTPSLNYTHLQNLTRSLAKKKKIKIKKGSWNRYFSGIDVWKTFPFSPCYHLLEPRKNKTLSINMNNTNMCISVYHHPSSIVSLCFSLVCFVHNLYVAWSGMTVCICGISFFCFFCLSLDPKPTHNNPPRESRSWCWFCICPSPNRTGMNS